MSDTLKAMIEGDRIDARAMAAIEVHRERLHRLAGLGPQSPYWLPAARVSVFGDTQLRAIVEEQNGEPLL